MTPAEAKNLKTLKNRYVRITWRDPRDDWPYYRLLDIRSRDGTIKLRGMDYPDGSAKHDGDVFWADWADVLDIEPVVVQV